MAEIHRLNPAGIEWVDGPPAKQPRKVDVVAAHLRAHPNEWAVIDRRSTPLMPWWGPLNADADFEVEWRKSDPKDAGLLFAPVDVYARYIGGEDAAAGTESSSSG